MHVTECTCIRQTSGVQKGKFEEAAIIFALPERQEFNDCSGTGAPVTQSFQGCWRLERMPGGCLLGRMPNKGDSLIWICNPVCQCPGTYATGDCFPTFLDLVDGSLATLDIGMLRY